MEDTTEARPCKRSRTDAPMNSQRLRQHALGLPGLDLGGIFSLEKMVFPLPIAIGLLYLFIEGLDLVEFLPSLLVCWLVMSSGWSCSGKQIVHVSFTFSLRI